VQFHKHASGYGEACSGFSDVTFLLLIVASMPRLTNHKTETAMTKDTSAESQMATKDRPSEAHDNHESSRRFSTEAQDAYTTHQTNVAAEIPVTNPEICHPPRFLVD
jgi:hypothetical protein